MAEPDAIGEPGENQPLEMKLKPHLSEQFGEEREIASIPISPMGSWKCNQPSRFAIQLLQAAHRGKVELRQQVTHPYRLLQALQNEHAGTPAVEISVC